MIRYLGLLAYLVSESSLSSFLLWILSHLHFSFNTVFLILHVQRTIFEKLIAGSKERIIDHNKRDRNSHILKHSREEGHNHVWDKDFKVLDNNFRSAFKRKISEALFIKQLKPSLNVKEQSIRLHLYNWLLIYDATQLRFQILMKYCLLLLVCKVTCYFYLIMLIGLSAKYCRYF